MPNQFVAGVAQLVEQQVVVLWVVGSRPIVRPNKILAPVVKLVDAIDSKSIILFECASSSLARSTKYLFIWII